MNRSIQRSATILPGALYVLLSACTQTPRSSGDGGAALTAAERAEGWQVLFDGSSLDAWRDSGIFYRATEEGNYIWQSASEMQVLDDELGSPEWEGRVRASKFASMPLYGRSPQGHIGLQDHGDRVEFRTILIRELP